MRVGAVIFLLLRAATALPDDDNQDYFPEEYSDEQRTGDGSYSFGSTTVGEAPSASPACKIVAGDQGWPADAVWQQEIPGIVKSPKAGNDSHPDWVINAHSPVDVQAAIKFANKYNVRVSIITTGHDFLGR
jgi:hypothetical protein